MGRPTSFTPEIANEICERIAKGESLRAITSDEESGWLPSETTVRRWLSGSEEWQAEFRRQYAHAREMQAEHFAEEIIEIADATTSVKPDGTVVVHDPNRDRLRIDARKWFAAKVAPKKYGEKVEVEHSGSIAGLTDEQLDAKIAALTSQLRARDEG